MLGDRVDVEERYGARSFWAAWLLCAYDFHVAWLRFTPVVRAEWLDADRDHDVGRRRQLSAGVGFPYEKRLRFLVDVTRIDVQHGTPVIESPKPLPAVPYFERDRTRVSAQLQLALRPARRRPMQGPTPYPPPQAPLDHPNEPWVAKCPKCGAASASKVGFNWWGGAVGPRLFHVVKCNQCGTQYNGRTGGKLTVVIIVYQVSVLLVFLALWFFLRG